MKKRLLFAALFSAALVSCTKDQVVEVQQDEIKFRVATENATKAPVGAVATNTNSIDNFRVIASLYTSDPVTVYMDETFTRTSPAGKWTALNTKHFWPTNALDFYAVSPSTTTRVSNDGKTITDYVADGNTDLLYSVKINQTKTDNNPDVALNFRHALSQIVFKAKNTNDKLGVAIKSVSVKKVLSKNTLTLSAATGNTEDNLSSDTNASTETSSKWGTWGTATVYADYDAIITEDADLQVSENTITLTADNKGLLLMPQDLTPWAPSTDEDNSSNGSYFLITCKIWNKVNANSAKNESVYLHGSAEDYAEVAIPTTDIVWQQGKKYVYTFIFGDGAGYIDPTDPVEPGDPVLLPIKLAVTVDEFQSATGIDVPMATN